MIAVDESTTIGQAFQEAVSAYAERPFLAAPAPLPSMSVCSTSKVPVSLAFMLTREYSETAAPTMRQFGRRLSILYTGLTAS